MGQAKNKGSFDARLGESLKRLRSELPESIRCQQCGKENDEVYPSLKLQKQFKVQHLGLAQCKECGHISVCIGDMDQKKLQIVSEFIYKEDTTKAFTGIFEIEKKIYIEHVKV